MTDVSLYSIKATLILDSDGNRVFAKYYTAPHGDDSTNSTALSSTAAVKDQKAFEKGLFSKTNKQNADVIIYDNHVVVYKQVVDVIIYIVACSLSENEAMLYQVVVGLRDALDILLVHAVDKRTILENYDLVALAIDETVDSGIILEVDPVVIAARTSRAPTSEPSFNNIELSEQGVSIRSPMAIFKLLTNVILASKCIPICKGKVVRTSSPVSIVIAYILSS